MPKTPLTRDELHEMIVKQVTSGCTAWRFRTKTRSGIVLRDLVLTLGVRPSPLAKLPPIACQSVSEVVTRLIHEARRVQSDGHIVASLPFHTEADFRVSLCAECRDRPGEARVEGRWVCGVCVPLDDAIGRAIRAEASS